MNQLKSYWMILLVVVVSLYLAACRFDTSGLPATLQYYSCETAVTHYASTNLPLDIQVGGAAQTKNYVIKKGFGDINVSMAPEHIYWDNPNLVVQDYGSGGLKGSIQIQTGRQDWQDTTPNFMNVKLLGDADSFFVAYDTRANPKPSWLVKDYQQLFDSNTGLPDALTISMVDQNANPPTFVKMEVWHRWTIPTNHLVIVPGNSYGNPGWAYVQKGNPAMYQVFVKPKSQVDYTKPDYDLPKLHHDFGVYNQTEAEDDAAKDCKLQYGADASLQCGKPACDYIGDTAAERYPLKSFSQGSQIKFDKPSQAVITIAGQTDTYTSAATGTLFFDYLATKHDMQLHDLILNFSPIDTAVGHFQNMTATLVNQAQAHCKDGMPVFGQPCTHYQIATSELVATESVLLDGKTIVWASRNTAPIDITINHTTKSFNAKGTIQATIKLNGQDTPMNIDLDLYGYFVNFAPIARADESTKSSECDENMNKQPIVLNAAGSFEIYLPDPTNLPRYEWYEDFGQVTEHLWGSQKVVTIPAHTLGYGIHKITLLVGDAQGLVDITTFNVTVADTTPPHLTVPPDISTDVYPSSTESVTVNIGQAGASDACSGSAAVSNDAPPNGLFPPGVTKVTWQADDNRGNIATAVQTVNVQVEYNQIAQLLVGVILFVIGGLTGGYAILSRNAIHAGWVTLLIGGTAIAATVAGAFVVARPLLNRPTPSPLPQLQLQPLDMSVSGDYDRVYCYVSLDGAPEVRVPEQISNFIPVEGGRANIAESGASDQLILTEPKDGVLSLTGECWGWANNNLQRLGPFTSEFPRDTWDGTRRALEGMGFEIGIAIQPTAQEGQAVR